MVVGSQEQGTVGALGSPRYGGMPGGSVGSLRAGDGDDQGAQGGFQDKKGPVLPRTESLWPRGLGSLGSGGM